MSLARNALMHGLMESRCGPPTALVSLASLHMHLPGQVNYRYLLVREDVQYLHAFVSSCY